MRGIYWLERTLEATGLGPVAGVDEAGRGACAGPLVAAAVVLPARRITGLADSKVLTPQKRHELAAVIRRRAVWATVSISAHECDELGLHHANLEALRRAVAGLALRPGFVLTDGFPVPGLSQRSLGVWKGDAISASVAAASILAKTSRDAVMEKLAEEHPGYGFEIHKGYATARHQAGLEELGPCPQHRMSYANVERAARLRAR